MIGRDNKPNVASATTNQPDKSPGEVLDNSSARRGVEGPQGLGEGSERAVGQPGEDLESVDVSAIPGPDDLPPVILQQAFAGGGKLGVRCQNLRERQRPLPLRRGREGPPGSKLDVPGC